MPAKMTAKAHPFLKWTEGRDTTDWLFESAEFQATPLAQRVVSSTFKPHGFGDYRLHADIASMCQWVVRTAPLQRNFNVVLLDQQPMYLRQD